MSFALQAALFLLKSNCNLIAKHFHKGGKTLLERLIDDPIQEYQDSFSNEIKTKTKEYFDNLIEENEINREENRETVFNYKKAIKKSKKLGIIELLFKILGWIFISPIPILILIVCLNESLNVGLILLCVGFLSLAIFSFITSKKFDNLRYVVKSKADELLSLAINQCEPLINAIESNAPINIFNEVIPNVKLDYKFLRGKHKYMMDRGAFPPLFSNECYIGVYSGNIGENPFAILKIRKQEMERVAYQGSLQIHWETVEKYEDEDGKTREKVVNHSQLLTATTYHDRPIYDTRVETIFASPIARELSFSRKPFGVKKMSDRKVERRIKSKYKSFKKIETRSAFTDKPLVLLENEEFEALYGAVDRDNEMQFRLLFTPLAQKNIVKLIRNRKYNGDDFSFKKCRNYNYSFNYSLQNMEFSLPRRQRYSLSDIDLIEKGFTDFVAKFSEEIYIFLLPFLSIPAYQKDVPNLSYDEYVKSIEKSTSESSVEEEISKSLYHQIGNSGLPTICKARYNTLDSISCDSYGFDSSWEVEYVTCRGDDCEDHDVPVRWQKFVKVCENSHF